VKDRDARDFTGLEFLLAQAYLCAVRRDLFRRTGTFCSTGVWFEVPRVCYVEWMMRASESGFVGTELEGGLRPFNRRIAVIRVYPRFLFLLFATVALLSGCGSKGLYSGGSPTSGTAPVVLTLTDAPATNSSILSAEVTLSAATLNPGNVSLLSGPVQLELTKLQTDTAHLSTTNVTPGSYTSLVLTFANPSITFENDTGAPVVAGVGTPTPTCAASAVCTIQPVATNLSTTIPLSFFTLSASTAAGLLVDVNLENLISSAFAEDFSAGTSASQFVPAGSNAPRVGVEDVVGQIVSVSAANSTFTVQNALGEVTLTANSATNYFQFPTSVCATAVFACVESGQILSVDIGIEANGTVVARNVLFEDANSTDTEVEGVITAINTGAQTFNMVTLDESAAVSGLNIGAVATVHYGPTTPLDIDSIYADSTPVNTAGFLFGTANEDLALGQEVMIQRNPASTPTTSITADRIRLRSSRITGTIQMMAAPNIDLGGSSPPFPSLFSANGISEILLQTSTPTIFTGTTLDGVSISSITQLSVTDIAAVRGPLFNVAGSRTLVASKVVLVLSN
jgi:hypothetical protein